VATRLRVWSFASGGRNATWPAPLPIFYGADGLRRNAPFNGEQQERTCWCGTEDAQGTEHWNHTVGLRGTQATSLRRTKFLFDQTNSITLRIR